MFVVSLELKSQWEPCNNGFYGPKTIDVLIDKNHLYVASRSNGIFLSKDDGNTWVKKSNGLNTNWINCIGKIGNLLILVTHDSGIYVSSDGGENWIQKNNGLPDVEIVALAVIGNTILISVENQGIYASNDGAENWIKKNLPNNKVKSLYVYKEKIIAATNYTLFIQVTTGIHGSHIITIPILVAELTVLHMMVQIFSLEPEMVFISPQTMEKIGLNSI